MSNTVIQIKRSLTSGTPASLNVAELAYSYASNTIFIGTPDGTGSIAIGGKSYLDLINLTFDTANSAYALANITSSSYIYSNTVATAANNWANTVGYSVNTYASILAANNAAGANAWSNTVGIAGNNYASILAANNAAGANAWSNTVGFSVNTYTSILAANNAVGANNWANTVAAAANAYATAMGAAGNSYAEQVGSSANSYTNATYVKLIAPQQTITGDLAITGNLTFTGNTTFLDSQSLVVGDTLIYLGANNYSGTDILDIGFVANYGNTTGANVHTGLIRDATTKQYYLFQGLDIELDANNTAFEFGSNGSSYAILNADLVAGNVTVGGMNVYPWIARAYETANSSNGWANTVGIAGNNYASILAANNAVGANTWANTVGFSVNTYASILVANNAVGANNWANTVGAAGNAYATYMATAGNNYTDYVALSVNTYASILVANNAVGSNAWANTVGVAGNNYTNTINSIIFNTFHDAANLISGIVPAARLSGSYTGITGVGTITTGVWNGSTVNVAYGGTGIVSATLNGVLFGSGGNGAIQVTSAGTEGQVLTASAFGVPQFSMLSGGTF